MKSKRHNKQYRNKPTKREQDINRISLVCFLSLFSILSIYNILTSNYTTKQITAIKQQQATTTKEIKTIKKDIKVIALSIKYAKTQEQKEVEFQIRTIAHNANFQWPDYLVRLALYESSLNPNAINDKNRNGSTDFGLYQWNSKNPPISGYTKDCYMSIECSTKITMDAINKGYQHHWMANQITIKNK